MEFTFILEPKVPLLEPCQISDVCADYFAQCRSGRCQCQSDYFEHNKICRKYSIFLKYNSGKSFS